MSICMGLDLIFSSPLFCLGCINGCCQSEEVIEENGITTYPGIWDNRTCYWFKLRNYNNRFSSSRYDKYMCYHDDYCRLLGRNVGSLVNCNCYDEPKIQRMDHIIGGYKNDF